jgi:putative ABC transport system permease protein
VLLAASAAVFWATGLTDYTLVLAPEGVAQIAVSYWAFAGPALLWLGSGLLAWRIAELLLRRRLVGPLLRPVAGTLAPTVAASLARRRHPVARSVVLLALALCFAVSTATFNATYQQQAEADAALTNGADVTVTLPPGPPISPDIAQRLAAVPGVRGAEPLQHRFAYVGADLQDLYGVRPDTIAHATVLQDAYFEGGTANQLLGTLTARPDSILVSAETVKDYQLLPGDLLRLRLPDARSGQPVTVPFHYVGIIKEFPTAPKDSFFVANAAYIAQTTGSDAVGAFLLDTGGRDTTAVTARVHELLGPVATVTDIADVRARIGSSLTAVDLAGLTRVELGFALVLAAAAGGLVLALGLVERRRSTAITRILGATPRQVRAFLVGESLTVGVGGILLGALAGAALAWMLVQVLTGVFDPPPSAPAVPWGYLALTLALTAAALLAATTGAGWLARRPPLDILGRP